MLSILAVRKALVSVIWSIGFSRPLNSETILFPTACSANVSLLVLADESAIKFENLAQAAWTSEYKRGRIVHEHTAPYTPEQNGRVEREMRTIMESARTSSTQTKNVSPYELWNGEKPALVHIRVFGSEGYVHVPDERIRKLDRKSVKLIFAGYEN
ncbi:unnamed protein product [Euphydryas editha]|uniref:Integrase catalytic domain-containing protein n=1 Tax=Euphydryas editha TaxID=104508 RepID=A0AAU9TMA3_EUPED|nr:unnamed protein product [Euphydryas editha]